MHCIYIIFILRAPQICSECGVEVLVAEASGKFLAMGVGLEVRHFTNHTCSPGAGLNTNLPEVVTDHKAARNKKTKDKLWLLRL